MSVPRNLIWTPAPTAELQLALHKAGAGPAALVPVSSGTVLLPARRAGFSSVIRLARRGQAIGGSALVLRWDATTKVGCSFSVEASRTTFEGSFSAAVRLTGPIAWLRLANRERGEVELSADVARVAGLVEEGRADIWLAALPGKARLPINAVLPVIPVTQGAVPTEQPPA